jgi:hypothetical protein
MEIKRHRKKREKSFIIGEIECSRTYKHCLTVGFVREALKNNYGSYDLM